MTLSYSGTGDTTYGPSATAPTNVGSYQVIATVAADANFPTASSEPFAFAIAPALLTVTADAKIKIFGAADPALTYQLTSGTLAMSDSFTGSLTRAAGETVGTYAIQQGTLTAGANYTITYVGADLTITASAEMVGLDTAITTAQALKEEEYTAATWAALEAALAMPATTDTEVLAKAAMINAAIEALVLVGPDPVPIPLLGPLGLLLLSIMAGTLGLLRQARRARPTLPAPATGN